MAKPIKHDGFDAIEGAAVGAAKGALAGVATAFAAGVAVVAAVGGIAALLGASVSVGWMITGALALGTASAMTYGTVAGGIGAAWGLVTGAGRVAKENDEYIAKAQSTGINKQAEQAAIFNQGAEYGAQAVMQQLQQHAQAEQAQHAHASHPADHVAENHHTNKLGPRAANHGKPLAEVVRDQKQQAGHANAQGL